MLMNTVEPIREVEKIEKIKKYLRDRNERDYLMFYLGISTGLRIGDILSLKAGDVRGTHIKLTEQKTRKERKVRMSPQLGRELRSYVEEKADHHYIFKSQKGHNKPISRSAAYKILRKAAHEFNLKDIGTHTMRKTMGYHYYKQTKDVALLQKLFNHSSQEITLRYIGINQDILDDALLKLKI